MPENCQNLKIWYRDLPYFTIFGHVTLICNRSDSALSPINIELVSVSTVFRPVSGCFWCFGQQFLSFLLHKIPKKLYMKYWQGTKQKKMRTFFVSPHLLSFYGAFRVFFLCSKGLTGCMLLWQGGGRRWRRSLCRVRVRRCSRRYAP